MHGTHFSTHRTFLEANIGMNALLVIKLLKIFKIDSLYNFYIHMSRTIVIWVRFKFKNIMFSIFLGGILGDFLAPRPESASEIWSFLRVIWHS